MPAVNLAKVAKELPDEDAQKLVLVELTSPDCFKILLGTALAAETLKKAVSIVQRALVHIPSFPVG